MDAARSARRWPLLLGLAIGLVLLAALAGAVALREGEARDALIALVSRIGARPVATADDAVPPAPGLAPVGGETPA